MTLVSRNDDMSGVRYFEAADGGPIHLVREFAYHSDLLGPPSLCGQQPRRTPNGFAVMETAPAGRDLCRSCLTLRRQGAR